MLDEGLGERHAKQKGQGELRHGGVKRYDSGETGAGDGGGED